MFIQIHCLATIWRYTEGHIILFSFLQNKESRIKISVTQGQIILHIIPICATGKSGTCLQIISTSYHVVYVVIDVLCGYINFLAYEGKC
jgi:hypothetical protein